MLVQEIVTRKNYLKFKLIDISNYIDKLETLNLVRKGDLYNKALSEKFELLSKIRSHDVLLERLNKNTTVVVGTEELSVCDAVALLKTLDEKIKTYDGVISHGDLVTVDFFTLINQRDDLFEEYILLYNSIKLSDSTQDWNPTKEKEVL